MIIVMQQQASEEDVRHVVESVEEWGLSANVSRGAEKTIVGVIGDEKILSDKPLEAFRGVESVLPVLKPYKLAGREFHPENTHISIPLASGRTLELGGSGIAVVAGPCSIENRDMLLDLAEFIKKHRGAVLRGGAFKPRTSPYAFQGLGSEGLKYLREAGQIYDIPVITEVMDTKDVELVAANADILQIGARNMQNFNLLKAAGRSGKPVMVKRGLSATLEELLMSAEYVMSQGNPNVILCERGIRTFETMTRNTVDINAIPVLKRESHLPVFIDPSHGTGHWDLVAPVARAGVAAGADGVIVELHRNPDQAFSDGPQALLPVTYAKLIEELEIIASAVQRSLLT